MKEQPEAADVQVGANIRRLRSLRAMSQTDLAEHLGITFQQIQKYEKGTNRVSASRLVKMASVFGVRIEVLFSGIGANEDGAADVLPAMSREALAVATDFEAIPDSAVRQSVRGLVKSLGRQQVAHAA